METKVAVAGCRKYDRENIRKIIREHFEALDIKPDYFTGKNVVIKPNLVSKRSPDKAATTHPAIVDAVVELLLGFGARVVIAESPAGIYTEGTMREAYRASGFMESASALGAEFNYDPSHVEVHAPDGEACKRFHFIKPVWDADVVVNLCKLKSHSLTKMTCAVKNYFGLIPGTEKVEFHARYSEHTDFLKMLIDLCDTVYKAKPMINICDAVLAMEGEGPGTGTPRWMNAILTSKSPYALDLAACEMIGFGNTVEMIELEKKRGLIPKSAKELEIIGTPLSELSVNDFVEPKSQKFSRMIKMIPGFMKPKPVINRKLCVGCGECVRSCPVKTITMENRKASIHRKACIRCFCCQELCPAKAVEIKRNIIFKKL